MIKWKKGTPPENTGETFLLHFKSGVICSGRYRRGSMGEPSGITLDWRCDCCGRFSTPDYWAKKEEPMKVRSNEDIPLTQVIQLEELGINWEVMEETGEADIPF